VKYLKCWYQKIDAPPHPKGRGLNGARFIKNLRFLNASQRSALLSLDA